MAVTHGRSDVDMWIDSACDIHIFKDKSVFTELKDPGKTRIQLGGEGACIIPQGKGPAIITIDLLSLGAIIEKGGQPSFDKSGSMIIS